MLKAVLAACAAFITLYAAPSAFAADQSNVLSLDRTRLIAQSAAGKSIQTQLEAIAKQIDSELAPEAQALETEFQAIQTLGKGLTQEQLKTRTDIKTRFESLNKRKVLFDQKRAKRGQELVATQNKADADFEKAAQPVLADIIKERGATLVVDLREVVFADPKIEITQDAITRLDSKVKSIPVVKVNLPDKPAGSGAASAPQ